MGRKRIIGCCGGGVSRRAGTTRRTFLIAGAGAIITAANSRRQASAEDALNEFLPCVDYPIRVSPQEPKDPTPIEIALSISEDGRGNVQGAPQMPAGARGALDRATGDAPTRGGMPARAPARLAALNKWDQKSLRVSFLEGSVSLHKKVLQIASEWSKYCGVEFDLSTDSRAEIRVGFETYRLSKDYGHWSYIGVESRDVARGRSMNLAITEVSLERNEYHQAVVRHEFGHALGCIHEHQNPGVGGIQFDEGKTIDYFDRKYGWKAPMTEANVLKRYSARELKRFSDFDPNSIMLYAYPDEITTNNRGTKQNYTLSRVDKEYIALLYDQPVPKDDGKTDDGKKSEDDQGKADQPRALPTDGTAVDGRISPSARVNKYTFEITSSGNYSVWTEGYTQVQFKLAKADGTAIELKPTTRDLVNPKATIDLPTGKYTLEVSHKHAGGTGEYRIYLKKP